MLKFVLSFILLMCIPPPLAAIPLLLVLGFPGARRNMRRSRGTCEAIRAPLDVLACSQLGVLCVVWCGVWWLDVVARAPPYSLSGYSIKCLAQLVEDDEDNAATALRCNAFVHVTTLLAKQASEAAIVNACLRTLSAVCSAAGARHAIGTADVGKSVAALRGVCDALPLGTVDMTQHRHAATRGIDTLCAIAGLLPWSDLCQTDVLLLARDATQAAIACGTMVQQGTASGEEAAVAAATSGTDDQGANASRARLARGASSRRRLEHSGGVGGVNAAALARQQQEAATVVAERALRLLAQTCVGEDAQGSEGVTFLAQQGCLEVAAAALATCFDGAAARHAYASAEALGAANPHVAPALRLLSA